MDTMSVGSTIFSIKRLLALIVIGTLATGAAAAPGKKLPVDICDICNCSIDCPYGCIAVASGPWHFDNVLRRDTVVQVLQRHAISSNFHLGRTVRIDEIKTVRGLRKWWRHLATVGGVKRAYCLYSHALLSLRLYISKLKNASHMVCCILLTCAQNYTQSENSYGAGDTPFGTCGLRIA
ncbi:hypothetical protein EJ03DRAFT_17391 [Teratosphaeria nubilosa]|uniref:4Fe-4S ferredoxin-type domain-containing protein n=1 Tax=Teratosphaeria nubilosa TaxID=161662 RepID=A0A6G1KVK7_9PEZI|nr:hypothetical protein EJ03DRAFT_17391 [Teratosphaeria nubilosa]